MSSKAKRQPARRQRGPRPRRTGLWARYQWWFIGGGVMLFLLLLLILTLSRSGPEATGREALVTASSGSATPSGTGGSATSQSGIPIVSSSGSEVASGARVSSPLPDVPLQLYQGAELLGASDVRFPSLLSGKPLVLNYWASACPPCRAEIPEFEKVWKKYKDRVLFFGLDVGRFAGLGGPETSRRELRELGATYPAAPVPDIETIRKLEVRGLPSTDFYMADGKVATKWVGTLNAAKLTELVEKLLNPTAPTTPELGRAVPTLPAAHAPPYTYNSRPPTSGNHLSTPAPYGIHQTPLRPEAVVHNMEHGGVAIWYQPGDSELAEQVRTLTKELGAGCLVAGPYADMEHKVAVTAWGRLLGLSSFDASAVRAFVQTYRGLLGPEAGVCQRES